MKDKNGKEIKIGFKVKVPEPDGTDIHNNEFIGKVDGFRNGYVTVVDSENDAFEIEPQRLKIYIEERLTPSEELTLKNLSELKKN
jgi:hypothetical protein